MNPKYLLAATFAAGLVIFVWGAISHTALPLPEPVRAFKDGKAVLDTVQAQTSGNAVYWEPHGLFVAVSLRPDLADKTNLMGPMLAKEALSNLACGFLLALVFARLRRTSVVGYGTAGLLIGLAAWVGTDTSFWNWYGLSAELTMYGLVDVPIGSLLAGLMVGWIIRKWFPEIGAESAAASAR